MTEFDLGRILPIDKGEWNDTYSTEAGPGYEKLDKVTSGSGSYLSLVANNTAPLTDRESWFPYVDGASIDALVVALNTEKQNAITATGAANTQALFAEEKGNLAHTKAGEAEAAKVAANTAAGAADAARLAIQSDLAAKSGESEEEVIASVINTLKNEVKALKDLLAKGEYSKIQAGIIDIQEDIKLKGSPLIYVGTTPPAIAPDQVPQFYVDITAKKLYTASGTTSAGNWF